MCVHRVHRYRNLLYLFLIYFLFISIPLSDCLAKREKTMSSVYFRHAPEESYLVRGAIFVTRGSYVSNVPRITASRFSAGRLRVIPGVRLKIFERESTAYVPDGRKRLEKTGSLSFLPLVFLFFFFLSYRHRVFCFYFHFDIYLWNRLSSSSSPSSSSSSLSSPSPPLLFHSVLRSYT